MRITREYRCNVQDQGSPVMQDRAIHHNNGNNNNMGIISKLVCAEDGYDSISSQVQANKGYHNEIAIQLGREESNLT